MKIENSPIAIAVWNIPISYVSAFVVFPIFFQDPTGYRAISLFYLGITAFVVIGSVLGVYFYYVKKIQTPLIRFGLGLNIVTLLVWCAIYMSLVLSST